MLGLTSNFLNCTYGLMKGLSQLKKPIQNDQLHFNFTGLGIRFWPWVSTLKILRALNQSENITIQLTLESYGSISVSRQLILSKAMIFVIKSLKKSKVYYIDDNNLLQMKINCSSCYILVLSCL